MRHFSATLQACGKSVCVHVEVLEGNPVVGIGPLEDRLEHDKVVPGDQAPLR